MMIPRPTSAKKPVFPGKHIYYYGDLVGSIVNVRFCVAALIRTKVGHPDGNRPLPCGLIHIGRRRKAHTKVKTKAKPIKMK